MPFEDLKRDIELADKLLDRIELITGKKDSTEGRSIGLKTKFLGDKIRDDEYKKESQKLLKGKEENEALSRYDSEIKEMLQKVGEYNNKILRHFEIKVVKKDNVENLIDRKKAKIFLKELSNKQPDDIKEKYTLYERNFYGQLSNQLFKEITTKITKKYPEIFRDLYSNLMISGMKIFSDTYINMAFLSSVLFFIFLYMFLIVFYGINSLFSIVQYLFITILGTAGLLAGFYYWPRVVIDGRRKDIKNELPFAIMHMASIAGSGAPLTTTFDTLLKSSEYKALSGEIKRIMNYVNLFGYNLSTALRSVAETTPSKDFKELLNGLRNTIETGGDLRLYLQNKADDTFINYKNDRKKYVETLATYSDIYTAVLIAAPLLFIIVLVLISLVGNKLGGLDIGFIEKLGIYFIVPAFNIAFIIFLNIVQPEL